MTANIQTFGYERFSPNRKGSAKAAIKRHVKYIETEKEHHQNKPVLFNAKEDHVNRIEFYKKINEQPEKGVVGHKLLLSMSEDEWKRGRIDLKELTRETMSSYEMQQEKKLDWVAAVHMDKGHPHVHIVLRGVDDRERQVGLYQRDLKELQKIAELHRSRLEERNKSRELDHDRDLLKELEAERTLTPAPEKDHEKEYERERELER